MNFTVTVYNRHPNDTIERGGLYFQPTQTKEVIVDQRQFDQIRACKYLSLVWPEKPKKAPEPAPGGDGPGAQVPPDSGPLTGVSGEENGEPEKPQTDQQDATPDQPESPEEGEQEVTPDAAGAVEVMGTEKEKEPQEGPVSCPYCTRTPKNAAGLLSHVRMAHPEQYEEFKGEG